jgi:hypothetical protein
MELRLDSVGFRVTTSSCSHTVLHWWDKWPLALTGGVRTTVPIGNPSFFGQLQTYRLVVCLEMNPESYYSSSTTAKF